MSPKRKCHKKPSTSTTGSVSNSSYWCGFTIHRIMVYYDVRNESFNHVSGTKYPRDNGISEQVVDWKGNLGMISSPPSKNGDYFLEIKLYDEMGLCWKKISSHGPIGMEIDRPIQCSKDGVILAEIKEGRLMLYDTVTNRIKTVFYIPEALKLFVEAFSYRESLVTVKGMEQVKEKDI